MSADELLPYLGMVAYEREAVQRALRETREKWLPLLEARLAKTEDPDEREMLTAEVRRLRRVLGIFRTEEARRAASYERVRRHRERKWQGIVLRPRKEPPSIAAEQILDELKQQLAFDREIEAKRQSPDGQ
jgi:hypothetical protein